jgi:hypothetical protein
MAKRRSKKLVEADRFQARVISLLRIRHADWNDWEYDWLLDEARRPNDYIYTGKERVILNRLIAASTTFTHYSEHSVQELVDIAYPYRKDLDEDAEEFLERIYRWRATDLKVRQISRLASLCRLTEALPRDETVADVIRAARGDGNDPFGKEDYETRPTA